MPGPTGSANRRDPGMSTLEPDTLNLPGRYLATVKALLRRHVPQAEVWAYGSRVTGTGHDASDLDLVLRNPAAPETETPGLSGLRDAFGESDLPIRVDIVDWARIPARFRREIERAHVAVQERER